MTFVEILRPRSRLEWATACISWGLGLACVYPFSRHGVALPLVMCSFAAIAGVTPLRSAMRGHNPMINSQLQFYVAVFGCGLLALGASLILPA